ncbi:UvrD-helicase domain-containing protein [Streptomycetaceae bacterium NBC_01309]
MRARLSLYQKAEEELYRLDGTVKRKFSDFGYHFRRNPRANGLHLKQLKGDARIYSARIDQSYRALLTRTGVSPSGEEHWLVIAVRHRKDVYEQLSVAINRISGAIEFVDLSVVGESALRRAGIQLTPAEPDAETVPAQEAPAAHATPVDEQPARPLLADHTADELRSLGVAESLIGLALKVVTDEELDELVKGQPLLSKDVLLGLASGLDFDAVKAEITDQVATPEPVDTQDFVAALARTAVVAYDEDVQDALAEGDFRAWKVYLHPAQRRVAYRDYNGPARVSGGPGTGKTIVALHRVQHLAQQLPPGENKPILLTTYTKNLAADLRARLASLVEPDLLKRVEVTHIDQLAHKVTGENVPGGRARGRIDDHVARAQLRDLLVELGETRWDADFLFEEWEQVILGQSVATRSEYFRARRAGRGRNLARPARDAVWKIVEQYTAHLDKLGVETWAQASERAARFEMERAERIEARQRRKDEVGGRDLIHRDNDSGMRFLSHRYRHIVVDEGQDLRPAHWKMLRAMVAPARNDLFIAGDTYQRIYDNQVSLGAVGVFIRGRSSRLTLSYRTTREILKRASTVMSGQQYDDLDDGTDTLEAYRSVLRGPDPVMLAYDSWEDELSALTRTIAAWRDELAAERPDTVRDLRGLVAVCVPDHDRVNQVMYALQVEAGITSAEITKDGPRGDGEVHVGTMHRFKGLEYQRIAVPAVSDGIVPRAAIERFRVDDPHRHERETRKARSLLFVATTRARDALLISWHGRPSPFLTGARQA